MRRIGRELRKGRRRKKKRGREERRCAQTDGGKGARREKTKLECGMRTSQCERAHRVRGHISIRIRRAGAKVSMQYLGLKSRRAQQVQLGDRTQYSVLSHGNADLEGHTQSGLRSQRLPPACVRRCVIIEAWACLGFGYTPTGQRSPGVYATSQLARSKPFPPCIPSGNKPLSRPECN